MYRNRAGFRTRVINRYARIIQIAQPAVHIRVRCLPALPQHDLLAKLKTRIKARNNPCWRRRFMRIGVRQRRLRRHLGGVAIAPANKHLLKRTNMGKRC